MDSRTRINPFPGIRPFMQEEADLFFGRDRQSDELVRRLASNRFLAVVGTSGSGKSSLVRAGLLPSLEGGFMAGAGAHWHMAILRPQDDPIGFLARAIVKTGVLQYLDLDRPAAEGVVETTLRRSSRGLVEAARLARLAPHENLLVLVDQFEELFRFADLAGQRDAGNEAPAFVKLLLEAAQQADVPVYVVITMRSDFLGDCARFRGLPEAISNSEYLIPRLTRDELRAAITGPIGVRGGRIDPSLVQRLLNDVGDDMDQLPVLQHALMRAWNHWAHHDPDPRSIDLSDLNAIGGMAGALSQHAEEVYGSLTTDRDRAIAERLFKCLTEKEPDNREIRRPTPLSRIARIATVEPARVIPVIDVFRAPGCSFLMPPLDDALLDDDSVIDISHESLIRQWQRLRAWAQAEADARDTLLNVLEAARLNQAEKGSLWRGHELATALEWQRRTAPTPQWVGLYVKDDADAAWRIGERFLDASARQVRRDTLRWRLLVGALGALTLAIVIVSVAAAVIGFSLQRQAKSRELASKALEAIEQNPSRSAHLALAAVEMDPENAIGASALRRSLATLEVAHAEKILVFGGPVSDVAYAPDGTLLIVASEKTVTIFDAKTFKKVQEISGDESVLRAWLLDKNRVVVTQTLGPARIQRVDGSAMRPISCKGDDNAIITMIVSPNERDVAIGCRDGTVLVWDATSQSPDPASSYRAAAKEGVTALGFSSDGEYLAVGYVDGSISVWRHGHKGAWMGKGGPASKDAPLGHAKAIRDIAFYRDDPGLLVTAADDNQAIVWRLDLEHRRLMKDKTPNRFALAHDRPVIAAKFTVPRDDTYPVITVSGKNARLWVNATADSTQVRAHDDWINDANASADGELLVTASDDRTARVWSTQSGTPIAVLRGHNAPVNRAVFSPGRDQLVTASSDATVRVWRLRVPRLLASLGGWVTGAAFDPSGTRVALGSERRGHLLELNVIGASGMPTRHDYPVNGSDLVGFLSWSRNGKRMVGVGSTTDIFSERRPWLWDVESGRDITPPWLKKWRDASFAPGTDELLTVDEQGQIAVWDMKSLDVAAPKPTLTFAADARRRQMAVMSPDGKWIAVVAENGVDLMTRDGGSRLLRHQGSVAALQFSRDNKWLLTASLDGRARLWPVDRPDPPKELSGVQTGGLYSAAFDASGERVVTGSADGTVGVWDVRKVPATQLASLRWHSESVNAVEFSPDGKWILSASDDGTVKLSQCDACVVGVNELKGPALRERVSDFAQLLESELEEIDRDVAKAMRYVILPGFRSRQR